MAVIEEYLQSVRTLLPRSEREDIIAELSANLAAQVEDRRAELGRPLGEDEERQIISQLGSPLTVAQRYAAPGGGRVAFGREWIGPVLFPLYSKVLELNLALTFGICLVITIVLGWPGGFGSAVRAVLFQLFIQFAIVTVIFVLAEHHLSRLPGAPAVEGAGEGGAGRAQVVSRAESIADLVALGALFTVAYVERGFLHTLFTPGDSAFYLSSAMRSAAIGVLALAVVWIVDAAVSLARPGSHRVHAAVRVTTSAVWLALLLYLVFTGPHVLVGHVADPLRAQHAADAVNRSVSYSLIVATVLSAVSVIWRGARAVRRGFRG